MEYLDGQPLSQVVQERGALPPQEVLDTAKQIASALDYIHQQNMLHRDVKSANILIDSRGHAVLTDFGLVRALVESGRLTASGTILGTPQYLAPEQISGGTVGHWSDLYALGVVVYEMLSGRVPFKADPTSALLFQVLWQAPPPINTSGLDLPEGVEVVLGRMLAKEPQKRYPTGTDFVASLDQALQGKAVVEELLSYSEEATVGLPDGMPPPPAVIPPAPLPVASSGQQPVVAPAPQETRRAARFFPLWLWATLAGFVGVLAIGALFFFGVGPFSRNNTPTVPSPTMEVLSTLPAALTPTVQPIMEPSTPASTTTPTAATAGPTQPAGTMVRATGTPTQPTATPISPTAGPAQPTGTPIPLPTNTPVPPPTHTPVPPPTDTPKPPPTDTPVPPPTDTPKPPPTDTPVPPPTDTPIPPPTDTPIPPDTPTMAPIPTDTPKPTPTMAPP
jgi:serine/threonine-protein kinase